MLEMCRFRGIVIHMFAKDHTPPHVRARYGEHLARFAVTSGEVINGALPRRACRLVQAWIELRRRELRRNWAEAQKDNPRFREVEPLR